MKNIIKFGTDGWRATPKTGLSPENIMICAQSFSDYINLKYPGKKTILIGYDTRKDSLKFALITAKVLISNNIEAKVTLNPTATPVCSLYIKNSSFQGGVIITASHNSKEWNGFKVRSENGTGFNNYEIEKIENNVSFYEKVNSAIKYNSQIDIDYIDINNEYINSLKEIIDVEKIINSNINISADYMHGASSGLLEKILEGKEINNIRKNHDSNFPGMIQPEPIEKNLELLIKDIKDNNRSIGIAFDGDGDRLGIIDEKGNLQSASEVFAILSSHILNKNKGKSIATTISMSSIIDDVCKEYKSKVIRTKVGFKYLAPLLENNQVIFAGEESGGYSLSNHVADKDGVLSALLYLECMVLNKVSPKILLDKLYQKYNQRFFNRIDIEFLASNKIIIENKINNMEVFFSNYSKIIKVDKSDGKKIFFDNGSWILTRLSVTEPLIRIYNEANSKVELEKINNLSQKVFNNYP
jgi:phosphomannomutase